MDIFIMVLCILLSAFFSATETAFSSVNKIKLISLSENGQDISNEINTQIAQKLSEYLSGVPDEKLATFIEVLSILEDKLDQENNNNKEGVN